MADYDYTQIDLNKENEFLFGNQNPFFDYIQPNEN